MAQEREDRAAMYERIAQRYESFGRGDTTNGLSSPLPFAFATMLREVADRIRRRHAERVKVTQ